jgi:hypothetical protein
MHEVGAYRQPPLLERQQTSGKHVVIVLAQLGLDPVIATTNTLSFTDPIVSVKVSFNDWTQVGEKGKQ